MKVLVIGSGGREHALAWKLAQSSRVTEVLVAPGNAGTATEAKCRNVAVAATDIDALLALVDSENVAVTVVGPEAPLVAGDVDRFRAKGHRIFGPTAAAAQLEGSKAYAKDFLARHGIPTTVGNHSYGPAFAQEAIRQYKSGRLRSIMIVGHSLGGGAAVEMAAELGRAGVPVDLVVTARSGRCCAGP